MKNVILLVINLLIVQLVHCQNGYPKLIKYKSDTVVAFTQEQVKRLWLKKLDCDEVKEIKDSIKVQIDKSVEIIDLQKQAITSLQQERSISMLLVQNNEQKDIEYRNTIETLEKSLKKRNIGNKLLGGGLVVSIGVVLGLLISN